MQWEKDANEGLGLEAAPRDKNALDRLAEETGEEVKKLAMRYLRAAPGTYIPTERERPHKTDRSNKLAMRFLRAAPGTYIASKTRTRRTPRRSWQ